MAFFTNLYRSFDIVLDIMYVYAAKGALITPTSPHPTEVTSLGALFSIRFNDTWKVWYCFFISLCFMIAVGLSQWTGKFEDEYFNKDWARIFGKYCGGLKDPKEKGEVPCCLTRFLRGVFC